MARPIDIHLPGGVILLTPPGLLPARLLHTQAPGDLTAVQRLRRDRTALAELRRGWPGLGLPHDPRHTQTLALLDAVEEAVRRRRLDLHWLPEDSGREVRAEAVLREALPGDVALWSVDEKVAAALRGTPTARAMKREVEPAVRRLIDPEQFLLAVPLIATMAEPSGVARLAAFGYAVAGWAGLTAMLHLGHATGNCAAAKTSVEIDAATEAYARAFVALGAGALSRLIARLGTRGWAPSAAATPAKAKPVGSARFSASAATQRAMPTPSNLADEVAKKAAGVQAEVAKKVDEAKAIVTGLGANIDKHLPCSPLLTKNLKALQDAKWTIVQGAAGAGSFADRALKTITIDPQASELNVIQTLAHEAGHALYKPDAYVPPAGLTREAYIAKNVLSSLKDEGEATLMNIAVNKETIANCKEDIGIAGKLGAAYEKVAAKYPALADRDKAREEIGKLFAQGENPSNDLTKTYEQYYAKPFADYWDKHIAPLKGKP